MTLAHRMGQSANCVSRFAAGLLAALAASAALAAAPGAAHAEQAAPAPAAAPIPRAEGAGPPLWVVRDADSTVYLFGTVHVLRPGTVWGSDKVDAAFASASDIWVEVADQDDQAVVMPVIQQHGVDPSRPLSSILSAEDFAALIDRNADWTNQIEAMMQGSGTAFVAVGAAHLMDQDSVIDMLTARGFKVERL